MLLLFSQFPSGTHTKHATHGLKTAADFQNTHILAIDDLRRALIQTLHTI